MRCRLGAARGRSVPALGVHSGAIVAQPYLNSLKELIANELSGIPGLLCASIFLAGRFVLEHDNLRVADTRRLRLQTTRATLLGSDRVRKGFTLAIPRQLASQERLRSQIQR